MLKKDFFDEIHALGEVGMDFFASAVLCYFRGVLIQCFGAGS